MDLSLFLPPLVACLVIVAIHSYLGLHVIAREVIFVDLSLAQMAALGGAVAVLAGVQPDSQAAFLYALGFTTIGAILFSLSRSEEKGRVPQEAIIGIVYVVASAAAILVADRTPPVVGNLAHHRPAGNDLCRRRAVSLALTPPLSHGFLSSRAGAG
jgi:zinc/manganese transport system permease protein